VRLEDLGLIGNCQFSALVHRSGSVVWCCLPRFDAEPVFGTLLDEPGGGAFTVGALDGRLGTQRYLPNTNILETHFEDEWGSFRVLDFAPRFVQHDRNFRPTQLMRIVEPLSGTPRISVSCDPRLGWSRQKPVPLVGSNHIRWDGYEAPLRLTTDIPLSYLGTRPFALTSRKHLVLSWGSPVEEPLPGLCERFLAETTRYWQRWVKHCNIPPHYQEEVIRSALALKLHCFEDTGAIIAATTTSIPESPDKSGRNWDYRFCWLRDAYYVVEAFRLLGHFEERERFLEFLLDIAAATPDLALAPLYRIDGRSDLEERILTDWPGFGGLGPVRVGNGAAVHVQNDVYGETVLALSPIFLDERFMNERSPAVLDLMRRLAQKAVSVVGQPDAGIWEYRTTWVPQTFSSLMCWAAVDRTAQVAARHAPEYAGSLRDQAQAIREQMIAKAWSDELGCFAGSWGGDTLDASLLQMATLRFLPPNDPRLVATVEKIHKELSKGNWLYRYKLDDGFGFPSVAFIICTFWLIEALTMIGQRDKARELFEVVRSVRSPLGLIGEDVDPESLRLWGNFPQAYSHVGLIHAAFAASPRWHEIV
jgi:GH15 family glucan-1,4-alpha-glucosidase